MLICQNCGAENEDHYRFCLACGSELAKEDAARIVDRPSRPDSRDNEKRPQINDLKNRLQALRVRRDATGVGEHDSVDIDRDAPLPGWTKPPMVVAPVNGSTSDANTEANQGPNVSAGSERQGLEGAVASAQKAGDSETPPSGDEAVERMHEARSTVPASEPGQTDGPARPERPDEVAAKTESDAVPLGETAHSEGNQAEHSGSRSEPDDAEPIVVDEAEGDQAIGVESTTEPSTPNEEDLTASTPGGHSEAVDGAPLLDDDDHSVVNTTVNQGDATVADGPDKAIAEQNQETGNETGDEKAGPTQDHAATVVESLTGSNSNPSVEFDSDGLAFTQPAMERLKLNISDVPVQIPPLARQPEMTGADGPTVTEAGDETLAGMSQLESGAANETDDLRSTQANEVVPESEIACHNCGKLQPSTFRFCGACGASLQEALSPPDETTAQAESIGVLTLIHSDGTEGEVFELGDGNLVIGREHAFGQFADDSCLSPVHVEVSYQDGWLTFKDLNSKNGIFVRLRGETRLSDGERFRIGQRLFRFESMTNRYANLEPAADGTHQLGSPASGHWGRLVCIGADGQDSQAWMLTTPEIYLGRDRGTICFPDDVFVSGSHCRLRRDGHSAKISDLSSTNGTYVESKGDFAAATGDLILLGQKLYRVDLATR